MKLRQFVLALLFCFIMIPVSATSPLSPLELFKQGRDYEQNNDLGNALVNYSKAIELDSNFTDAYMGRARVYTMLREYDKALADNSKCIELKPLEYIYYLNRARNFMDLKEYKSAIADYSRSIELADVYFSRRLRGEAYIAIRQYDLAMVDFNRMGVIRPKDSNVYLYKSQVYGLTGDYNKAIEECNQGISIHPENSIILFNLGQCYELLGNKELAIEYYTKALNKDLAGRYSKKTVMIKNKIAARIQGDWDSYSEWIYF